MRTIVNFIICIGMLSTVGLVMWKYMKMREPTIYIITPTFNRTNQRSELVRLCTVFTLAGNIHWLVIEDSDKQNPEIDKFLKECGLPYTHLNYPTPKNVTNIRGSGQRNEALKWLRKTFKNTQTPGIVYFGDDDNTYHPDIFKEMRTIKRGGVWPVGFISNSDWEGCITSPSDRNRITGFWASWMPSRKFPVDMAAFAVHLNVILSHPDAYFDNKSVGLQEGTMLASLGFENAYELEPKADGCTKILVWHTKSARPIVSQRGPKKIVGMFY